MMVRLNEITYQNSEKHLIIEKEIKSNKLENLEFGFALEIIKAYDYGMRLPHWSKDVVVRVQNPDINSKMTVPYLYVGSRFERVPWKETMAELFSNGWEIVD